MQTEMVMERIFERTPTVRICFHNSFVRDSTNGDYLVGDVRIPKALVERIASGKELLFTADCYLAPYLEVRAGEKGILLGTNSRSGSLADTQTFIPMRLMYKYAVGSERYPA